MPRIYWAEGIFKGMIWTKSGLLFDEDFEAKNGTCQTTADNIGKDEWKVLNEKAVDQPTALSSEHHGVHGQAQVLHFSVSDDFPCLRHKRGSGQYGSNEAYGRGPIHVTILPHYQRMTTSRSVISA